MIQIDPRRTRPAACLAREHVLPPFGTVAERPLFVGAKEVVEVSPPPGVNVRQPLILVAHFGPRSDATKWIRRLDGRGDDPAYVGRLLRER
jgi:hypothetical protein